MVRLQALVRWVLGLSHPAGVALLYHRVAEPASDPFQLCVSPRQFAEHMDVLSRNYLPVRLDELGDSPRPGRTPVAVTFDDGYADNLHAALPVLERYGIPATFFITTGCISAAEEFWWDELDRLVSSAGTVPPGLEVRLAGAVHTWTLADRSGGSQQPGAQWSIAGAKLPSALHRAAVELVPLFRRANHTQRQELIEQLRRQLSVPPAVRPSHRTLTTDELVALARSPLADIGAHTLTHPVLAHRTESEQRAELLGCRTVLRELTGCPIAAFAYPHGRPTTDYTPETVRLVREAGYDTAWTTVPAPLTAGDPWQRPRFIVPGGDGDRFARWLHRALG
jgi:peptidoglycan/xylan/chitin deacetylase (PgdA/CDA1 family)